MEQGRCKSCGAAILWARTARGKWMPLDAQPHAQGTVAILDGKAVVVPEELRRAGRPVYRCHFVSCPRAKEHRRHGAGF